MGRPTLLNPELLEEMCELFEEGNSIADVCGLVGLGESTYFQWMQRGERAWEVDQKGGYVEFADRIKKARSSGRRWHVKNVRKAATEGNWQASAWFLERSDPDNWARRDRYDVKHEGELNIKLKWNDGDADGDAA